MSLATRYMGLQLPNPLVVSSSGITQSIDGILRAVDAGAEYVDANSPKDMVTARPGEVTKIRATFDKPGRYVWHCHILSHEDHEMMRVLHVGEGA